MYVQEEIGAYYVGGWYYYYYLVKSFVPITFLINSQEMLLTIEIRNYYNPFQFKSD